MEDITAIAAYVLPQTYADVFHRHCDGVVDNRV